MKKTKLLMPLTGIAAIGAIAPVAIMTSCNKGDANKVFEGVELVNGGLFGHDEISWKSEKSEAGKLTALVKATVKAKAEAGHSYKHSWVAQTSPTGLLSLAKKETPEAIIDSYELVAGKTYLRTFDITVNKDIKEITADETFTFKVKYDEYETTTNGEKLVGSQEVPYTVKVSATKVAFPKIDSNSMAGNGTIATKKITFNGWTTDKDLADTAAVNAKLDFGQEVKIEDANKKTTLVLPATQTVALPKTKGAISFEATATWTQDPTAGKISYEVENDCLLTVTLSTTSDKYVATSWTHYVEIDAGDDIEITYA